MEKSEKVRVIGAEWRAAPARTKGKIGKSSCHQSMIARCLDTNKWKNRKKFVPREQSGALPRHEQMEKSEKVRVTGAGQHAASTRTNGKIKKSSCHRKVCQIRMTRIKPLLL